MSSAPRTVMVLPTYNEIDNLAGLLARLRSSVPTVDVLVVDDASPDGTGDLADDLARRDPAVRVLHRSTKQGLGAAYLEGFTRCLGEGYEVIGQMDADGSHQPEQLPRLIAALPQADLVIGSRWVPGGSIVDWPLRRELLSRTANAYARTVLGTRVRDLTAGYRLYRRSTLEAIHLDQVSSLGYVFQTDLTWRTLQAGLRVVEVPIEFVERQRGVSKMDGAVALESWWRITGWALTHRARGRRETTTPSQSLEQS